MNELFFLLVLAIFMIVFIHFKKTENFSSLPPISRSVPWGSEPSNLYGNEPSHGINTMGLEVSEIMKDADFTDYTYKRALGFGIGDINKKLGTGIHAKPENGNYI